MLDSVAGWVFQKALDAELAGDQASSFAWRRLLFAVAREVYGLRVAIKYEFAVPDPERRTIMFADDLLDGIRAAVREPKSKDAQLLPREWSLDREWDGDFKCHFVHLVSPGGKRVKIVGIDTDVLVNIDDIKIALRSARKYNTVTKPKKSTVVSGQLSLQPLLIGA